MTNKYSHITTKTTIVPEGKELLDDGVFSVSLEDEGGGCFVTVAQLDYGDYFIKIDMYEWKHLRTAINEMMKVAEKLNNREEI